MKPSVPKPEPESIDQLIANVIRPVVRGWQSYHVPSAEGMVKLDAMENPYLLPAELREQLAQRLAALELNRYPVPSYTALKAAICKGLGVPAGYDVLLGNGSDELITLLSVACAQPGRTILAPEPGFVMYGVSAKMAGLEYVGVPLCADLSLDLPAMLAAMEAHKPVITWLGYPNNPTGTLYEMADVLRIVEAAAPYGLVVVDEAYQPFAASTLMPALPQHNNLVLMRTVSKLGLAGIRLGYLSAAPALLRELDKVRPPYNVNVLTEAAALFMLEHLDVLQAQAARLRQARSALAAELAALDGVQVFPSAANFLLIRVPDADKVCASLLAHRVLVKNAGRMHVLLQNCLRITVSSDKENAMFLAALKTALREL
ncbi:histidinol-phosphate transaminase [Herbaspirillum seropedicae]|uniref:Histidinol-phosphate aminotransferase n=1 Tax=Herbaspirillum seropedicae (strain SmR1) TaxID=757424 RepID=D8ITA7_HERSS|nr:histidinol-phosphate transaminase [Herbaspirillum seropedicae]ADJ65537.1 histidinol-phosphate aminotransferase 1 protein [Herbaspirillum seropedicae SmR1]AKN68352.1 histidinol-phosphate aminotransferase [Herbaspirillum seropedicae]NQE32126.1 histidinol-phosphate aminotransferase [Herbaspirillum seropedicae]UMU23373.1 histidinol-phosphate transaminase [Herbaspirillum seropedicae]